MSWSRDRELHTLLAHQARLLVDEIPGPTTERIDVIDGLLDVRNLGHGRDLGLELTVDEMLEQLPPGATISSEWWLSCLNTLTDHAAFLAAGYPPALTV